jgi:ABC-type Fe3+/spermidine/putrescine transport system ATPase subunit
MQGELKALQRTVGITFIYVTHDQEEAMNLSDVIVVMEKGKIAQVGSPEDVYRRPASQYVADFVGETNFLAGGLAVRPENVLLGAAIPQGAARGRGIVREKSFLGANTRLEIDANDIALVATSPGLLKISAGDTVEFGWREEDSLTLPISNGEKI